jgi:hypothetical protein
MGSACSAQKGKSIIRNPLDTLDWVGLVEPGKYFIHGVLYPSVWLVKSAGCLGGGAHKQKPVRNPLHRIKN